MSLRRFVAALLLGVAMSYAWAEGTLTHMSGVVSILKADGKSVPGTVGAKAYAGDTVVTGAGGYVRMEMTDGGEMVLRPDSQLKIEAYKFAEAKPAEDSVVFSMLRGGLRTVTGLIGKRGNKDAYELKTDTATMGIRGTQYDLRVCQGNCGALADGTYVAVRFGAVQASSPQGSMAVAAGQVAYVPPKQPPVMLPRDPGIGFTPPAVIPKLDEKKKVQASAAAAAPEQAKPAASGQAAQTTQQASAKSEAAKDSGAKAESSTKSEAAGKADTGAAGKDGGGADAGNKPSAPAQPAGGASGLANATSAAPAAAPFAAPATQSAPGTDCSVQ